MRAVQAGLLAQFSELFDQELEPEPEPEPEPEHEWTLDELGRELFGRRLRKWQFWKYSANGRSRFMRRVTPAKASSWGFSRLIDHPLDHEERYALKFGNRFVGKFLTNSMIR